MDWITILKIVSIVLGIISGSIVPLVISLANAIKKRKTAQTEAEKQRATNDMLVIANQFIEVAETLYKDVDAVLKNQGGSAGAVKKECVMTKLQAYAMQSGYDFDIDYWNEKIDELVKFTKNVNAKNETNTEAQSA